MLDQMPKITPRFYYVNDPLILAELIKAQMKAFRHYPKVVEILQSLDMISCLISKVPL